MPVVVLLLPVVVDDNNAPHLAPISKLWWDPPCKNPAIVIPRLRCTPGTVARDAR